MGSSVLMVWPPTMSMPASRALSAPPRRMSPNASAERSHLGPVVIGVAAFVLVVVAMLAFLRGGIAF